MDARNEDCHSQDETLDLGADADTPVFNLDSPSSGDKVNDGNSNGLGSFQNTAQYDETLPLENDDFMLETVACGNVTSLGGDTQVVDNADFSLDGCNKDVALNTDSQGTDHTEVVLSDDEYNSAIKNFEDQNEQRKESEGPVLPSCLDGHKSRDFAAVSSLSGEFDPAVAVPHSFSSNCHEKASGPSQGCTKRSFTAVRSASLRLSGLAAARSITSSSKKTDSSTTFSNSQGPQLEHCKTPPLGFNVTKRDEEVKNMKDIHFTGSVIGKSGRHDDNANRNLKDKVKSARARKLFVEDTQADIRVQSMTDHTFAGLSYVDSQEPGESSQQRALNIVDKFLCVNDAESPEDAVPFRLSTLQEKSPHTSVLKGRLSLAQWANPGSPVGKPEIYDWVDSLEDEGGGDFFTKRKDVLLGNGDSTVKSKSELRRPTNHRRRTGGVVGKILKTEDCGPIIYQKILGLFHSDSRSLLQRSRKMDNQFLETELKKNIAKEVDEQLIEEPLKDTTSSHGIHDIGFDTQLAAEAMEALGCEPSTEHDERKTFGAPDTRQMKKGARLKQLSQKRASSFTDTQARMRKSKRSKTPNAASCLTRSKSVVKKPVAGQGPKGSEQEQIRNSLKIVNAQNTGDLSNQTGNRNANLCLNSLRLEGHATPVAHRTRQSEKGLKGLSNATDQVVADPMGNVPKKRRSVAVIDDAHKTEDAREKCLKLDPCQNELPRRSKRHGLSKQDIDGQEGRKCHNREVTYEASSCHNGKRDLQDTGEKVDEDKNIYVGPLKAKLQTPCSVNAVSPVCMGDNAPKLLGKNDLPKSPGLRELIRLDAGEVLPVSALKIMRRRRDMSSVRILLSNHLGDDVIRQQKKIMARLGVPAASCASDATHFVADEFVRTRNMLEAMALGKSVVTHLWLQSCGQASCFIDEKDYILKDHKKEKEIGFNMRHSLARAIQYPLLQGKRVLITPNSKPNKELLACLVKAVRGQPVERLGRSAMKNDKVPDDLLIISCEEDYMNCMPLLEKGAEVYGSELLLNGIVIQKLEYQRHRLFVDHVKKTRSTIWLRNGSGNQFRPVARNL